MRSSSGSFFQAVRILHMIQDLIKKFQPDIIIEGSFENEPLAITVTRSLHKSINESSLKQEMDGKIFNLQMMYIHGTYIIFVIICFMIIRM